jgi:L-aspartate oxidase
VNNSYDITIIGSGLAGLYTALNLDPHFNILVISKDEIEIGSSDLAQGGIAATLTTDEYDLASHIEDTLIAGASLNDLEALKILVSESKDNIERLIDLGVQFDRSTDGKLMFTREGGHNQRRILHAGGDATGKEMMQALRHKVLTSPNIDFVDNCMVTDLVKDEDKVVGIKLIDSDNNCHQVISTYTVIATGGIGNLYLNTTNPKIATGDGVAIAYRAGAEVSNLEFIQFHPTSFYDQTSSKTTRFLISEAVRGEGAYLRNIEGERFMDKYDERLELAPRDIVSQSIYKEMYDTWSDYVYLDIRHKTKTYLVNRFPTIYTKLAEKGLFMEKDLIPVAPAEHYSLGGINIDLDGKTSVPNLFANGECSDTGVHGANRLASNSLLECVVFGRRIATHINTNGLLERPKVDFGSIEDHTSSANFKAVRRELRHLMTQNVGIVRSGERLLNTKNILSNHLNNIKKLNITTKEYFITLNMVQVALLIVEGAINRKESIGCHFRID